MKPPAVLALYAAGLAVVLAAGAGVGALVDPVGRITSAAGHGTDGGTHGGADRHAAPVATTPAPATPADEPGVSGLAVTQDGFALALEPTALRAGEAGTLAFRVLGPDGEAVRDYEVAHEKELHLVLVRRSDARGYQHLHPERDASGRWSTPLAVAEPGTYKAFVDFVPAGRSDSVVLAADVAVAGSAVASPLPAQQRTARVDGYEVTVRGDLVAGTTSRLVLRVTRGGRPVDDLEPYLGAFGHLVALRDGDLAYLHVHPDGDAARGRGGPEVVFSVAVPTASTYRLFFDFQAGGAVRSAALSLPARGAPLAPAPTPTGTAGTHGDDHGH